MRERIRQNSTTKDEYIRALKSPVTGEDSETRTGSSLPMSSRDSDNARSTTHCTNFLDHFCDLLTDRIALSHGYNIAGKGKSKSTPWSIDKFEGAFFKYSWAGKNYPATSSALEALRASLRTSASLASDLNFNSASRAILKWGGVDRKGSIDWLNEKTRCTTLVCSAQDGVAYLEGNDDGDPDLRWNKSDLLMNSGMTKIYAMLSDNSIIYDGRVGAALGFLVNRFCNIYRISPVPAYLKFPWGSERSKTYTSKTNRLRCPGVEFPQLGNNCYEHARWNLRANWLLEAALNELAVTTMPKWLAEGTPARPEQLRRIEAALFMIGYVVNPANCTNTQFHLQVSPTDKLCHFCHKATATTSKEIIDTWASPFSPSRFPACGPCASKPQEWMT